MGIIDYDDGISRDTGVASPNVYIALGQGCSTVWFKTVKDARAALLGNLDIVPDGHQAGVCEQCACHYSSMDPLQKGKHEFACRDWKDHWTQHLAAPMDGALSGEPL